MGRAGADPRAALGLLSMAELDAGPVSAWVREFARLVHEQRDELTALDAAIGDADHGTNLDRGLTAVVAALDGAPDDPAAVLKTVAMTLIGTVGGASGPLYGTFFLRAAGAVGDGAAAAFRAGVEGVAVRGRAEPGDKTMLDALVPACDALEAALADGAALRSAVQAASGAAARGRDATAPMVARKGRASYLGERSAGHVDPGAASSALLWQAAATAWAAGA